MSDHKTTIKIRGKIAEARKAVLEAEKEFNDAWDVYSHTHSREARHAVTEANKKATQLHAEWNAQYDKLTIRRFGKLERGQP